MSQAVSCRFVLVEDLGNRSRESLHFLYRTLIGAQACSLYEMALAYARGQSWISLDSFVEACGFTRSAFESERKKLEKFSLFSTFVSEDESKMECWIYSPLEPGKFLLHEVYGRILVQKISVERLRSLQNLFKEPEPEPGMTNITASLSAFEVEQEWDEQKETMLQLHLPQNAQINRYPFDWKVFFRGMDRVIPERLRTRQNMMQIAYLAHVYGVSELDIRPYVARQIKGDKTYIDFDAVTEQLKNTTKMKPAETDPVKAAPLLYLRSLQPENTPILPSERTFLEELSRSYNFSDEVINTLLEYCLEKCNQAFVEQYIRKVAATWTRNHVTTRAQALDLIEKSKNYKKEKDKRTLAQKKNVSEWFLNTETTPTSPELLDELKAIQDSINLDDF